MRTLLAGLAPFVLCMPLVAQTTLTCDDFRGDLVEPDVIEATDHVLNTTLRVQLQPGVPIPVYINNNGTWVCTVQRFDLRQYGYPTGTAGSFKYGFPGPTLHVRKPATASDPGDRIRILLVNGLHWDTDQCNANCPAPTSSLCTGTNPPQCCKSIDTSPNCFHGNNVTNLHFHGTHVSPQPPQDYVLLELQPEDTPAHTMSHAEGIVAKGQYQYDVDPLPVSQADGTHWYHPHKHGSTALQLANGMAGALIIEGPFDDWLRGWYKQNGGNTLREHVLVIQQIHALNFTSSAPVLAPLPLIDGKLQPTVHMNPGEVQRWRFISATMEASAQLKIDLNGPKNDSPVLAKQIAFDGITFVPENYKRQPLLDAQGEFFRLSPGNRADFLIKAPAAPGLYKVTYDVFGRVDDQNPQVRRRDNARNRKGAATNLARPPIRENVRSFLKATGGADGQPPLLYIQVDACTNCSAMSFPPASEWQDKLPPNFREIDDPGSKSSLLFFLGNGSGGSGAPAAQPQQFAIGVNGGTPKQFDPTCVDFSMPLDTTAEWTIKQNVDDTIFNLPFHVFHIHTNPFQLVQTGTTKNTPPWVWADSITLQDVDQGQVVIRQRFEDYTGQFVLHCHFLGHEDRGMMLGVQTVCANGQFGHATTSGKECVEGNYFPAAPICGSTTAKAKTKAHKH
jgi:FtsP/CotA-like multicopper oxidase with cupredoxin domain